MDGISNHFPAKFTVFSIYILKIFPRVIPPDHRRSVPGAWTQTPNSVVSPAFPMFPAYETSTALCIYLWRRRMLNRCLKNSE